MSNIKDIWNAERLKYQQRYFEACENFKMTMEKDLTEFSKGQYKGAMLEMSWVLISIFGLSTKQVDEVERNKGFTNKDLN